MSRTERFLMIAVLTVVGLYALDYFSLRWQIPNRPQFGAVPMKSYYAVKLKNGKTEIMPGDPDVLTCTNSLFPQIGYAPCWYARKKNPVQVFN